MSKIIELSNNSSSIKFSNSEWINTFPGLIIKNNDVIRLKNVFLDTRTIQPTDIEITEDQNISISFMIYVSNSGNWPGKNVSGTGSTRTVQWHRGFSLAYHYDDGTSNIAASGFNFPGGPAVNTINFTIKKGVYSPFQLCELMSREMQEVRDSSTTNSIICETTNYDQGALGFCLLNDTTGTVDKEVRWVYSDDTTIKNIFVGATQLSLLYDDENDGKIKFQFAHTPIYDTKGNIGIRVFNIDGFEPIFLSTRDSGLLFTSLEPKTFWEDTLGFDLDYILCSIDSQYKINYPAKKFNSELPPFYNCTVGALDSVDTFYFGKYGGGEVKQESIFYKQTTNTSPLVAINSYKATTTGPYVLIELSVNINNKFHDEDAVRNQIMGIVSRNWGSNGYVTGYSDSSIDFVYKGSYSPLGKIKCRILDPVTKQPIENLGNMNTIFLEIISNN